MARPQLAKQPRCDPPVVERTGVRVQRAARHAAPRCPLPPASGNRRVRVAVTVPMHTTVGEVHVGHHGDPRDVRGPLESPQRALDLRAVGAASHCRLTTTPPAPRAAPP